MSENQTPHDLVPTSLRKKFVDSNPDFDEFIGTCALLKKAQKRWENFQDQEYSEFRNWFEKEFALEQWKIGTLKREIEFLEKCLDEIADQIIFGTANKEEACQTIWKKYRFANRKCSRWTPPLLDWHTPLLESGPIKEDWFPKEESETPYSLELEEWEKEIIPESAFFEEPPRDLPEALDSRIKNLYRYLARQLHPDLNPNLTSAEQDFWLETQRAYKERNVSRLETLTAVLQGLHEKIEWKCDAVTVLDAQNEMLLQLTLLRSKLRKAKGSPAWNFTKVLRNDGDLVKIRNLIYSKSRNQILYFQKKTDTLKKQLIKIAGSPNPFNSALLESRQLCFDGF
jgi:hypothetical protein